MARTRAPTFDQQRASILQAAATLFARQQGSDAPEVVHQARVGWRRLRSLARLFAPACAARPAPAAAALAPLLQSLGHLRDLDVARTQTLPALAAHYAQGGARQAAAWAEAPSRFCLMIRMIPMDRAATTRPTRVLVTRGSMRRTAATKRGTRTQ